MNSSSSSNRPHLVFARASASVRRYLVSLQRPDGQADTWHRTGGSPCDHALEAQEVGGLGSVVRVVPIGLTEAE